MSHPPAHVSRANGKKGGRPLSKLAQIRKGFTAKEIQELIDAGEAPLNVMINNMLFWFKQAQTFSVKLEKLLVSEGDEDEKRGEGIKLLRTLLAARENAQSCAVDAAPYCHPRLATIEHQAKGDVHLHFDKVDESA